MRVLNAAQTTLAYLGVLAGHEHTFDAIADPLLAGLRPPHAGRGERCRRCRRCPASTPQRLCRAEPRPPAQHRDPPSQPPDRHRRLAEDRAAPAQSRSASGCSAARASRCCRCRSPAWMAYLILASAAVRQALDGRRIPMPSGSPAIADRDRPRRGGAGRRHPRHRHASSTASLPRTPSSARLSQRRSTGCCRTIRWPIVGTSADSRAARLKRLANGDKSRWEDDEARIADRAVSGHAARARSPTGRARPASRRWRSPAGRNPPARPAAMPAPATSTSPRPRRREAQGDRRRARRDKACRSRRSATIPTRCIPTPRIARPSSTHLKKVIVAAGRMGVAGGQHLLRRRCRRSTSTPTGRRR